MANWVITDGLPGSQAITETSTTQKHPLGYKVKAKDISLTVPLEGEFIYAKGVASTVVGDWVTLTPDDGGTVRLVANAIGSCGVAMSANVADQYGWYQIYGKASANAAAAFADNGRVYITATAGVVDDAVVDGDLVHNALGASTIVDAGLADFEIAYPYTDDIATND